MSSPSDSPPKHSPPRDAGRKPQAIYLIDDNEGAPSLANLFGKAFKTKDRSDGTLPVNHIFKNQSKYCFHQILPIGTWYVDLIHSGDFWYIFFVEANSRYLVVIQGNSDNLLTPSSRNPFAVSAITPHARVRGPSYEEAFNRFLEMVRAPITQLIGDSEKVFWSRQMIQKYRSLKIKPCPINVKQDGHIRLSIIDRIVRTIRDMAYNIGITGMITPSQMVKLCIVYNHTEHSTFKKLMNMKLTPKNVHENLELQKLFIRCCEEANIERHFTPGMLLKVNQPVLVKATGDKFEKRRYRVIPADWKILKINSKNTYDVINTLTNEVIQSVPRQNLQKAPY